MPSPYLLEILADDWLWRSMGGEMILVTEHGGARVVIAPSRAPTKTRTHQRGPHIVTPTEQEGGGHVLRPIAPDHPLALVLAAVPQLVQVVRRVAEQHGWQDAQDALKRAGLA